MCLILFAYKSHPELPLIVAANRDEFYRRPSRPADFWPDHPDILAGRDLEALGTWLGVSRRGRFAAVTNVRGGADAGGARSRGELTRDFLSGDSSPWDYAREVLGRARDYRGFNLLVGDREELVYCENLHGTTARVEPGIYGLSNHLLDTPWPKVVSGKSGLQAIISRWHSAGEADTEALLDMLGDRNIAEDELLPATGLGLAMERRLSPIFVSGDDSGSGEGYGTCCSTVLVADQQGRLRFHERRFYGEEPRESRFDLRWGE